jgi:hypothetical protein
LNGPDLDLGLSSGGGKELLERRQRENVRERKCFEYNIKPEYTCECNHNNILYLMINIKKVKRNKFWKFVLL